MARSFDKKNYDPRASFASADQKLRYGSNSSSQLAAWFEFSGGNGSDSSGNDRNGTNAGVTPSNDTPYTTNLFSESGQFGTSKSISFGSASGISSLYDETILSFSFWIKFSSTSGTQRIFQMGNVGQGLRFECIGGNLVVTDSAWSTTDGVNTFNSFFSTDVWTHVFVKLDRELAGYTVSISKNGSSLSPDSTTMSAGTRRDFLGSSYLGQSGAGSNWLLGKLDSFTIWTTLIPSDEISAIYDSSYGIFEISSGIISNPVRILLQERDCATGSYPTIARTGDPDFTGVYRSFYDDTNTINFVGNSQTVYPTALPAISKWVSGGIATPNILQGLIAAGTSSKGVADAQVSFTPGQNISPFNESRIYIDNDSTFYATGTSKDVLPGFDQRLGSKISITIDINPASSTDVFFSTGSVPNATLGYSQGVNSGISYFNFQRMKWEVIGDLTTGSNLDIINYSENIRRKGLLAFAPSGLNQDITTDDALADYVGLPVNNFGFPFSAKYDATGSQLYCMSASINQPFLVEKVVIEFSASFGPEYIYNQYWGPCVKQFFLLNQFDNTNNSFLAPLSFSTYFSRNSGPALVAGAITQSLGKTKDLIGVGEISLIPSASSVMQDPKVTNQGWLRDLNIVRTSAEGDSDKPRYNPITGTYRLEFQPRIYPNQPVLGAVPLSLDGNRSTFRDAGLNAGASYASYKEVVGTFFGGRQLTNASSGNSFIKSVAGTDPSGSADTGVVGNLYPAGSSVAVPVPKVFLKDLRTVSPYVLTPYSKIAVGFSNTPNFVSNGFQSLDNNKLTEGNVADAKVVLSPGTGKITLYGSLLRNNLPVSPLSNQPLTSDAIHEDLHYDNSVFDQFDVEPYYALTGSYVDLIITGSMLATPIGSSIASNVRKVQGSVVRGQAGTTGSLQRFVKLTSESDLFYDTLVPNPAEINSADGFSLGTDSGKTFLLFSDVNVNVISNENYVWWKSYPFESKYTSAKRRSADSIVGFDIDGSGLSFGGFFLTGSQFLQDEMGRPRNSGLFITSSYTEGLKSFFGIPRNYATARSIQGGASSEAIIAGFKHGLQNCLPTKTFISFRRDRYGQFRDMLEQSPNAAYFVANSVEYPLEVKFFSRQGKDGKGSATTDPTQTHSQNLSSFATSSLPYFDGVARERPDNPDITVEPIELIELG